MKFEYKMSGIEITDFEIIPIFKDNFITLKDCIKTIKRQKTMDFILKTFHFYGGISEESWTAVVSRDDIYKISILENYPNYEEELSNRFGEEWLSYYLRFNH